MHSSLAVRDLRRNSNCKQQTHEGSGMRLQATHAAKVRITCTHFCSQVPHSIQCWYYEMHIFHNVKSHHITFSAYTTKCTHFITLCVKSGNMGNIPMVLSGVSALYYKEDGKFTWTTMSVMILTHWWWWSMDWNACNSTYCKILPWLKSVLKTISYTFRKLWLVHSSV